MVLPKWKSSLLLALIFGGCFLFSCKNAPKVDSTPLASTETVKPEFLPSTSPALETATPAKTADEFPIFDPLIPNWVQTIILDLPELQTQADLSNAPIHIGLGETPYLMGEIQYLLVTQFQTPITSIPSSDLDSLWKENFPVSPIIKAGMVVSKETEQLFIHQWGNHHSEIAGLSVPEEEIIEILLSQEEYSIAIIPAQFLTTALRTVRVNQESFFSLVENSAQLMFRVPIYSSQQLVTVPSVLNFDTEKVTTINITGVTALVRATAVLMQKNGTTYPAEQIRTILLDADFTTINNEVSFSPSCPPPEYTTEELKFCSGISTFELLRDIDADIIDLSGDHLEDFGTDPIYYSLSLYQDAGMLTYGGGENIHEAQQVLKFTHNGNQFAFIGCNAKHPAYARAADNYPGTWHCDLELLTEMVQDIQEQGYLPIVTIQHLENELTTPPAALITDFAELAKYPPIILIGSQAHVPKPFNLIEDVFIHYGLGNLFFDQINESEAHAQSLIDRVIMYDGKLINVELFPLQFIDYAQSRPMTAAEEILFLEKLFSLSQFPSP